MQSNGNNPFTPVNSDPSPNFTSNENPQNNEKTINSEQNQSVESFISENPQIENLNSESEQSQKNDDSSEELIKWTASEAVAQERGKGWYISVILIAVSAVVIVVLLWIFKIISLMTTITTGILVVIITVSVFVIAKSPIREVEYILTNSGIIIDGKLYPFKDFRSFGVRQLDAMWQLILLPIKRFGVSTTIFIHEDQGEEIVDILGAVLPMEEVKIDTIDKIVHKLKM